MVIVIVGVLFAATVRPARALAPGITASSPPTPSGATGSAPPAPPAPAAPAAPAPPPPTAAAYVLADVKTGAVIAAKNDRQPLPPASLTKMLTALVATGWLPPNAAVPVNLDDALVYPDRIGMIWGQTWSLPLALQVLLIFSANDAAYAIAERVAGTVPAFGAVMDEAATEMGMADHPVLHDPAGLDSTQGYDGGNLVSARDLAIAGRDLLAQPELASIVGQRTSDFVDPAGVPHHILSKNLSFLDAEPGGSGVKTGYTGLAGSCLVGSATQGGRTLMAVVLNGSNPTATAQGLLTVGFASTPNVRGGDALPPVVLPSPAPGRTTLPAAGAIGPPGGLPFADNPGRSGDGTTWAVVGGGAGLLVAVVLVVRIRRRGRRRTVGAHSRIG